MKNNKSKVKELNINNEKERHVISKELFCKVMSMFEEQDKIIDEACEVLEKLGSADFLYGAGQKYYDALVLLLEESFPECDDLIGWWLIDGAKDRVIHSSDTSEMWILKTPEALYDFLLEFYCDKNDEDR